MRAAAEQPYLVWGFSAFVIFERTKYQIPQNECIAVVPVRFLRQVGMMPAMQLIGTEHIVQQAMPGIQVGVLPHHHRLAEGEVGQNEFRRCTEEHQWQQATEDIQAVVQWRAGFSSDRLKPSDCALLMKSMARMSCSVKTR